MHRQYPTVASLRRADGTFPPLAGADPITDTEQVTIDDVAQSVAQLRDAVTEMRNGLVDSETVERIATEVQERQQAHAREQQQRAGYQPEEDTDPAELLRAANPMQRVAEIHQRSAGQVASLVRHSEEQVRDFHRRSDNLVLLSVALGVNPRETRYFQEEYLPALRAMDTQTATEGKEFIPRDLSGSLIERVNLDLMVAALFPQVVMPTQPFDIPAKAVSRTRLGSHTEQTGDTGQAGFKKVTPGSRNVTLTAMKFAGEALVSKEAEEDAIIAILPFIEEELLEFLAADIEDAILNGDTAATHQDSDVTASNDPRKNFKGLRKTAIAAAKIDGAGASLDTAKLLANRKAMKKYGIRAANLAHVVSMAGYVQLLADQSVQTVDKYGPNATVLTGELGKAHGVPVIVSEYVRQDENATGVYDGVTTTKTEAITVHTRGFVTGERRGMTVQLLKEVYAEDDQDAILVSTRRAFAARFTDSTEPIVARTYNLAS